MGTNFYARQTPCPSCSRADEIHIGKRSGGWSFGFRGYRHTPDDGLISPFGVPVLSRAEWLRALDGYDGRVFDEYGSEVADPLEWLKSLQPPDPRQRRWEDDHMGPYWRPDERTWRDPEGFRFFDGEFS